MQTRYLITVIICLSLAGLILSFSFSQAKPIQGMMTESEKSEFFKNHRFTMVNRLMAEKGGE